MKLDRHMTLRLPSSMYDELLDLVVKHNLANQTKMVTTQATIRAAIQNYINNEKEGK